MSNAPESGALRRKTSVNIRDTRIAGLYDLGETIGQGHFAVVKLAKHVFTGEKVAVKIIDKTKIDEASTSQIMQEVRCMKLVQHANIVRLYEVLDTQTKIFLILELGDYDLHDFISKHEKGVSEHLAQQYFCQIMTAIDYCHQLHVVHRDLKPENVVFFEKLGMVKLTDFGFSNCYEPGEQLSTSCGSLAYSAPEILLGDSYDAPAVDVWSLGVILYMLLCGRLPFQEANDPETITKILDCKYSIPENISNDCANLIRSMLVREPTKRATLDKICSNPWVQAGDQGLSTAIPLIVRHHLPISAHTTIVEQMVAGGIASEEDILRCLENDEYNSTTATYYLLAERVLASYREEQAREIMEKHQEQEESVASRKNSEVCENGGSGSGSRCRSRSNSWRARPCSMLKEESEEELSTYLRSASRQSSRFYQMHDYMSSPRSSSRCCSAQLSRQNSEEQQCVAQDDSRPATFYLPGSNSSSHPTTPTTSIAGAINNNRFDELSPINECGFDLEHQKPEEKQKRRRSILNEICDDSMNCGNGRKSSDSCLHVHDVLQKSASSLRLLRRNSSPSVSMFSGISRDRVSPQAVQDLLDLNRLGGGRGRAASPESCRSSRSPSPPASSSGRTSPAMSTISSMSRLKVGTSTSSSGMRKLSSSPHLLGICEETEESGEASNSTSNQLLNPNNMSNDLIRVGRTNRSASTGVVHNRHHSVHASKSSAGSLVTSNSLTPSPKTSTTSNFVPNTYSAVRMIRPRQAIVSPDVCRRYERFAIRSRRSTSCSSSEASDEDDSRRLTMLSSKCGKFDEKRKENDDDEGNGGFIGEKKDEAGGGGNSERREVSGSGDGGEQEKGQNKGSGGNVDKRCVLMDLPLRPIPEMTLLDQTLNQDYESPGCVSLKDRIFHASFSQQTMIRKWTEIEKTKPNDNLNWFGTPPRDNYEKEREIENENMGGWMRCLRRTKSSHQLKCSYLTGEENEENDEVESPNWRILKEEDEEHDISESSNSTSSSPNTTQKMYNVSKFSYLSTLPAEKVDRWLKCAEFVF